MKVVTISAAYGAGGSIVGPGVAQRLGIPFVDRAIPTAVAHELGCSIEAALARDERSISGLGRLFAATARVPNLALGGVEGYVTSDDLLPEEEFVRQTERAIHQVANTTGGVILGRAAAFVLAHHPDAIHIRLTGSEEDRLA